MNWDEVGAVGQMLGSIAVFITLGYLAVQVRHAREQMVRATRGARSEAQRHYFTFMATNPEFALTAGKLNRNLGITDSPWTEFVLQHGGTREEALKLLFGHWVYWAVAEQIVGGIADLTPGERRQFDNAVELQYGGSNPAQAKWYETVARIRGNPDTVSYVDNLLSARAKTQNG